MAIDPTAAAAAAATSATTTGKARLAENFDTFLSLLTSQLKNQDPLSPMDANQFTAQIVQMTGVEQQLLTNDLLQKLVTNSSGGVAAAVGLIGKEVRAVSTDAALKGDKAAWTFNLDANAADVKVEVLDSTGKVVHAEALTDVKAGDRAYTWDGKDALGHKMPEGTYTLRLAAKDASGESIGGSIFVDGLVTAVEQSDGKTLLTINGGKVPWETVNSVRLPTGPATANTDDETSPAAAA
jgi:flagellar basal-body rod modification protein FlgD